MSWIVPSERVAGGDLHEVAIVNQVERTTTEEIGVGQVKYPLAQIVRLGTDGDRLAILDETASRSWRGAVDVVVEGDARRQRERRAPDVLVGCPGSNTITPGEARRETTHLGDRVATATTGDVRTTAGI